MRLVRAQVTHFRSIVDSNEFELNGLTCLVGKNESGKTALLQALHRLNPHGPEDAGFNIEDDYPRRFLLDYEERHPEGEAVVVRSVWKLEPDDTQAVEEVLGPGVLIDDSVHITRDYAGRQLWAVKIDRSLAFGNVLEASTLDELELEEARTQKSVKRLISYLEEQEDALSERQQALLGMLHAQFEDGSAIEAAIDILSRRAPTFLYFSAYHCMPGQVQLEALATRKEQRQLSPEDQVFLAFLSLAGITLDALLSLDQFEPMLSRLEAAGTRITREVFRYWTQNRRLQVKFHLDVGRAGDRPPFNSGRVLRTRIYNPDHEISFSFDRRSSGFVWFFSFAVLFSQYRRSHGNKLVILLDEPGLSLHATGQTDLLRYIEEQLLPQHQVIFTTHSPFMVPASNLRCTRTVEDVVERLPDGTVEVLGTKVRRDAQCTDPATLLPLHAALGYEISRNLAVGKHTLLVQSAAELLYLQAFSLELQNRGRVGLDPRWQVCPLGSIEKIPAFLSLLGRNNREIAVFSNLPAHMDLRGVALLKKSRVLSASMYTGVPDSSIEDMLGKAVFFDLVNRAYGLTKKQRLLEAQCARVAGICNFAREALRARKQKAFDLLRPAVYLFERRAKLLKGASAAERPLELFESLFSDLNALL